MRESIVETYFKKQTKLAGGLPLKFISPSQNGVPDQILLFKGKTYYAEIKAPGEKPRPDQVALHKKFLKHGVIVHVIDSKSDVDNFIKNVMKVSIKTDKKNNKGPSTPKIKENQFIIK